jgi:fructokinase
MRKVIGIGETVLDIIFRNDQPISAIPGGSTFNAIISLGRCGVEAGFISETGNDRVGHNIIKFLRDNGCKSDSVNVYPDSKSPLSLAFLNDQNDAEYIFYKDHPHDRLDFTYPDIQPDDLVLFGSYYALNQVIRPQVKEFLEYAHEHGAILYYDVNFRASHQHEVMKITPNLLENFELADIVRGSIEDFEILFKKNNAEKVYRSEISFYTKKFIVTHGGEPIDLFAEGGFHKQYPIENRETVSTIGAGDNFNAGFLFGLLTNNITRSDFENGLTEEQWDKLIASGQQFSAEACRSLYNYVSPEFGAERKKELELSLIQE